MGRIRALVLLAAGGLAAVGACTLSTAGTGAADPAASGGGGSGGGGGNDGGAGGQGTGGGGGAGGPACTDPTWTRTLAESAEWLDGPAGTPQPVRVSIDAEGGSWVVASFLGSAQLGVGDPIPSHGGRDILVAKHDAAGAPLFAAGFGTPGSGAADYPEDVALDAAGRPIVASAFDGPPLHGWVLALEADGAGRWDKVIENGPSHAVEVDPSGNAVVVGHMTSGAVIDGLTLPFSGAEDAYVIQLRQDGTLGFRLSFGDGGFQRAHAVAIAPGGGVAVTGLFQGTLNMNGTVTANGDDAYLLKLAEDGTPAWIRQLGGADWQSGRAVAFDPAGDIVVAGAFQVTLAIPGGDTHSAGEDDVFVAKFDAAGNYVWSKTFGDSVEQDVRDLVVDAGGRIYLTGHFHGAVDFGGGPLQAEGNDPGKDDVFLAVLDPLGNHLYSARFGGAGKPQRATGIALAPCGNVALAGTFDGNFDLGAPVGDTAGGSQSFLAKLGVDLP